MENIINIDIQRTIDLLSGTAISMGTLNIVIRQLEIIQSNINKIEKNTCRTLEEIIEAGIKAVQLEDQYEHSFDEIIEYFEKKIKEG